LGIARLSVVRGHLTAMLRMILAIGLVLLAGAAEAQSPAPGGMPPPPGMSLAQSNAMRFPQPVRAGTLRGRAVLQPVEAQVVLGRVRGVVRDRDGSIAVVVALGGLFGWGARPIAVPADAMVLLGQDMEVVAFTPAQLRRLPTFSPDGSTPLADADVIRIGLAKPSH
jgi:hypothetical protein